MNISGISTAVFSALGNNSSSIAPLFFKDQIDNTARTAMAYKAGGRIEARERFVDENGTSLIWMGGIPLLKKVFDKTAYKAFKIDPSVDIKLITSKNKQNLKFAIEHAPTEAIKNSLENVAKNKKLAQGLYLSKFAFSTVASLAALCSLIKYNQKETKKKVYDQVKRDETNLRFLSSKIKKESTFTAFSGNLQDRNKKASSNVAFAGGFGDFAKEFMMNPLKNTMILDAGISTERIKNEKRNPVARAEVMIKEACVVLFMYVGGKQIQKVLEKVAEHFKTPVDLDVKVLDSKEFKESMKDKKAVNEALNKMPEAVYNKKELKNYDEIFEYIHKNPEDMTVKIAKQSGLISTVKNSAGKEVIDTSKHLDVDSVIGLNKSLKKFAEAAENSGKNIEHFLKKAATTKKSTIALNLAICAVCTGIIAPAIQQLYRKQKTGTTKFHVAEQYRKEAEAALSFQASC